VLFLGAFCDRTEKDQIHFITSYVILCKFFKYSNLLTFAIFSVLCAFFFFISDENKEKSGDGHL